MEHEGAESDTPIGSLRACCARDWQRRAALAVAGEGIFSGGTAVLVGLVCNERALALL